MDNNNTVLDRQKLLNYIYNECAKIDNKGQIYAKILNYANNLKKQEYIQNINDKNNLNTLKKNIIDDLDKAGKELENLEDIMFNATLLLSSITSIDFSKNDIYKKLDDFYDKAKNSAEYLKKCYKNKSIPTEELKNYVSMN